MAITQSPIAAYNEQNFVASLVYDPKCNEVQGWTDSTNMMWRICLRELDFSWAALLDWLNKPNWAELRSRMTEGCMQDVRYCAQLEAQLAWIHV